MVVHSIWRMGLVISWFAAAGLVALAPGETYAQASCAAGGRVEMLGSVALCIPSGNDRYRFKNGRLALFWRGEEPVSSSSDTEIDQQTMTIAMTPWGSEADRQDFSGTVSAPILEAAKVAGAATTFDVELSIKDNVDRVPFERLPSGVLRGRHQAKDDDTVIFLHETQSGQQPDLMICSDARGKKVPNNTCMAFAQIAGKPVAILVLGYDADLAFKMSEQAIADLRAFAVPAAP